LALKGGGEEIKTFVKIQLLISKYKLEAQWAEPVSLIFHSALRKLNTEPFTKFRFIWLSSYREEDF
jgi:hypothetical protein